MSMTQKDVLPFEQPLQELKARIAEMINGDGDSPEMREQAERMQQQADEMEKQLFENVSPWNTVQLARHPKRPQTRDYTEMTFDHFVELHGDRSFRDDLAIVTGLATLGEHRVMVIGQHKGRNVEERHECHAGCPHPEGYRKALLKMRMAERFGLPIICLIDTKGAYPGLGSEERGQGIALAENIRDMSLLRVPIVCCVIGEGGSGGALAIGVGDRMLMMRYAYYSVISPEGCASILWRDGEKKVEAASVLKLTSRDLKERGFVDDVVPEPMGGAHRDPQVAATNLRDALIAELDALVTVPTDELLERRYQKFRAFGEFLSGQTPPAPFAEECVRDEESSVPADECSEADAAAAMGMPEAEEASPESGEPRS